MKKEFSLRERVLGAAALGLLLIAPASGCAAGHDSPPAPAPDRFAVMDVNGDGKVTLEEFTAANPNMSEQAFVIIDRDKNKAIEPQEWTIFTETHGSGVAPEGAPMNNIPGDPLIPPPDSDDLPLVRPPLN